MSTFPTRHQRSKEAVLVLSLIRLLLVGLVAGRHAPAIVPGTNAVRWPTTLLHGFAVHRGVGGPAGHRPG